MVGPMAELVEDPCTCHKVDPVPHLINDPTLYLVHQRDKKGRCNKTRFPIQRL